MKIACVKAQINTIKRIINENLLNIFLHKILDRKGRTAKVNAIFKAFNSDKESMEKFGDASIIFIF